MMAAFLLIASLLISIAITSWIRNAMQECKNVKFPLQAASKIIVVTGANSGLGTFH